MVPVASVLHDNECHISGYAFHHPRRDKTTARTGQRLTYSELTGPEKCNYLFNAGIRPTAYENYQGETRPEVFGGIGQFSKSALESIANHLLSQSLTRVGDELEVPKPKLFHTYGTTAKIRFTPEPNTPYTGILSKSAYGLARFSYAGPVLGIGVVPGLGLKFLIDGDHPSENLVVMRKLDPQHPVLESLSTHSHNSVFQNAFTNILPLPSPANVIMQLVKIRFETVVIHGKGLHQSLDNLASVHTDGRSVDQDRVVAPYRVIFQPTLEATAASDPAIDFRDDLARNIVIGTTIYDVFALSEPQEAELTARGISTVEDLLTHAEKIGAITTESEFIASKYGDYRLFFKHSDRFIQDEFKTGGMELSA